MAFGFDDLLAAGGSIIGGELGREAEERRYREALAARQRGVDTLRGVNEQAINKALQDPALRQAALESLGQMRGVAAEGGMDVGSRVAQTEALDRAATQARANREGVLAEMAARGGGGGGSEVAARLAGQQAGANQAAVGSAAAAASARQRALAAMAQSGQMSTQQQYADLSTQEAQNAIERFNAAQRLGKGESIAGIQAGTAPMITQQGGREYEMSGRLGEAAGRYAGNAYDWLTKKPDEDRAQWA